MGKKTLYQLYAEHTGKLSDKWSLYLTEYDRLFDDYRDKPIRLLEIGIQNGGSFEIWARYFSNASALIGCDINPDCARISYDDPRINVIVGDANASEVRERVFQRSPQFDIIIDDGSHLSSDIIKSFVLYFPRLMEGGVFIAEDLHCSYWDKLQGGLFDPYSSISFFKRLADVINHEHWGISKARVDILRGIFAKYGCEADEEALSQVHSIEFINSMCVVRKAPAADNSLGYRVIAGSMELVVPGHLELHGRPYQFDPTYDQSHNPWAARVTPPDEAIQYTELALTNAQQQIASLSQTLCERREQIASLSQTLRERGEQIVGLSQTLCEREERIASLSQIVKAYQDSTSWWLTKPIRFVGQKIKRIKRILFFSGVLFSNLKELKKTAIKLKSKGLGNIEHYLKLLQSEEYAAQVSRDRGLSPEFLKALIVLGTVFLQIKQWWFVNKFRRKYSERLVAFFLGKTEASRKIELSHIRVHIDKPNRLLKIVDDSFVISGWGVDLNANAAANIRVRIGKIIQELHMTQREDVQRAFASVCDLPLDVGFVVVPSLSIGLHRLWIDVEGPHDTWIPVRRVLLLRRPRIMLEEEKQRPSYKAWTRIEQNQLKAEFTDITRHIDVMLHKPTFTVIIDARQSLAGWERSLQSTRKQIYPNYELRVLINVGFDLRIPLEQHIKPLLDTSLADVLGDFIVFIKSGQSLSCNALYEFSNTINQYPHIDLIYGDEDRLSATEERSAPFYKPDWSPDYLETFNYIGFPTCFRTAIARGCFDNAHLYDFVLRFTERTTNIWHVSKILGHTDEQHVAEEVLANIAAQDIAALQGRLSRTGRQGIVREHELYRGCYDIELDIKRKPFVSIIIPTAGKTVTVGGRQIDMITNVIDQIRNRSTYKNIEIIVVDNGDLSERQQQVLVDHDCHRITYTEPVFNISKKLNLGASIANGELFLLMNDDIEILAPSWIERMVEHFEKPYVGVVGAKLLYPNGQTQHVGVVHNHGNPDHVRRNCPRNEAGYYFSTCGVRNFMAVTGAIMMTLSKVYREIGGYSEELAVSYNDVDYCLKVQEKGLSIVYAPKVELTHMESQSRIASADMREVAWYHKRWAAHIVLDPYYNEQFLTVEPPTFVPYINPRKI